MNGSESFTDRANPGALISFVVPIYNEELTLPHLLPALDAEVFSKLTQSHELILVNDGSRDGSLPALLELERSRHDVRVVNLSRNFGHQIAVTAGMDAARGDAVVIMDADMQDPPRVCLELIEEWVKGSDVVYAQRRTRQDTLFKKATAAAFYKSLSHLADINIPENTGDFRLMSRSVVDELARYGEHDRFLRGMAAHVGFTQKAVPFDRDERIAGETGYPLRKMLKLSADGILGFSKVPLQLISRLGFFVAGVSLLGIIYAIVTKFFFPQIAVAGWAFTVVAIFFVGGIQLIMLGILGSYIGRIFEEVKGRPLYSIDDSFRRRS
ncbi:glycosyltransferase [Galactobacter valiniphilus]|uniref:Glycosyltransferase n=1 Tax=Galactobacter valiniphilus TaxID=2676122 RepID=A0A399JJV3_9MICC|nr:glycosyltransferase family 2 protein [Galactobacter valiniphilus]RII42736.1 glycosyltransferase [Galactobacter valiniphilus]